MQSSGRTAQLELWREIVSKTHDETQPVNRHLDFIRKRFEELEKEDFIWSKESIIGIFLQFGLPESTNSPFSSVNETLESRALQGFEISSYEVEKVIQNEEFKHKSRPVGLLNLPIEILEMILEKLDCMAKLEAKSIQYRKRKRRVMITPPGDEGPYFTYVNHRSPILNSMQAFSLVSREIYQICRPWLWRKLEFPTSLPGHMDLWNKNILLRQGSYVRSLTLTLSSNCSKSHGELDYPVLYDNLTTDPEDASQIESISPKNIRSLIKRCPKLSTLDIRFDYYDDINDYDGTENFLIGLIPLLSSLKHLRHFTLQDINEEHMYMYRLPSKLIGGLPLLESLVLSGSTGDNPKSGEGSVGCNLSKLKFLSQLDLDGFDNINQEWCLYDWPKTMTDLSMRQRGSLSPSSAHQIIHHIAPNLSKLMLSFWEDDSWETFSLPLLTDLELSTKSSNSLDSFRNCISLRSLYWPYRTLEHCQTLNRNLSQSSWPQLRTLVVVPALYIRLYDPHGEHREFEREFVLLENYCKLANIKLSLRRPSD